MSIEAVVMIKPYDNEEDCFGIGNLTIENRLDRIQIYGSIELTKDQSGLDKARELKKLLDTVIAKLETEELPVSVAIDKSTMVDNPFK
jgi:hypothetical protein